MKLGVNHNISNEEYHSDKEFLSSSAFKMLHKDPSEFYKRYILGEREVATNQSALDFGTCAHLALLEPHLFDSSIAEFTGPIKRGKVFDIFKSDNPGKIILSSNEIQKLNALKEAFLSHPHASILNNCEFEHTLCGIYSSIPVKVRADAINIAGGYIADVKTTGYAGDLDTFKTTVEGLYYDLSAALYCHVAEQIYGRPFDFYFIVLSKNDMSCNIYKTSKHTMSDGILKMRQAAEIYMKCQLTNKWEHENLDTDEVEDKNQIQEV